MTEHNHTGPDHACEACRPLADVLRKRMRWPSLHWGAEDLHDDAYPSLARAVWDSGLVAPAPQVIEKGEVYSLSLDHETGPYGGHIALVDRPAPTTTAHWAGAALADAETKAALLGDGYVRVTRHEDGSLTYASVDPTLIEERSRG